MRLFIKRYLPAMLSCILIFVTGFLPNTHIYAASSFSAAYTDVGIITVTNVDAMYGKLTYYIYKDGELINQSYITVSGNTTAQIGIPNRSLPSGSYDVNIKYIDNATNKVQSQANLKITAGVESPVSQGGTTTDYRSGSSWTNNPGTSRAIMIPYAKVYGNDKLTGKVICELKRHDIVQVEKIENGIAKINVNIQSKDVETKELDKVNAELIDSNAYRVSGYIKESSFTLTNGNKFEADKAQEAVELAYSRLGTRGVYSQSKRYQDYYVDCSALVNWCWYQAGIDMSENNTLGSNCNSIVSWAYSKESSGNVILWDAMADEGSAYEEVQALYHHDVTYCEVHRRSGHDDSGDLPFDSGVYASWTQNYLGVFDDTVVSNMQPGDIVVFNYYEDLTRTCDCPGVHGHGTDTYSIRKQVCENNTHGADHVAIYIGKNAGGTPQVIEALNPTANTKVSTLTGREEAIIMVIRPTGCTKMDTVVKNYYGISGATSSAFTGTYYAGVGELTAPIRGFTTANVSSKFGYRIHPISGVRKMHKGIDIAKPSGTPIYAAASGEVIKTGYEAGGYGYYVYIQHSDNTVTRYAHMQQGSIAVYAGQKVDSNTVIGKVGSTGASTGPHLHFEVRYNGTPTNPLLYIE